MWEGQDKYENIHSLRSEYSKVNPVVLHTEPGNLSYLIMTRTLPLEISSISRASSASKKEVDDGLSKLEPFILLGVEMNPQKGSDMVVESTWTAPHSCPSQANGDTLCGENGLRV